MQLPDGVELWTITGPGGDRIIFTSGGRYVGFLTAGCDVSDEAIELLAQQGMEQDWDTMQGEV